MKFYKIFFLIMLLTVNTTVMADDFVPEEDEKNSANNLMLDADNTGGDISLQFGATLAEYLRWNSTNLRFDLSDTLRVAGNLEQEGNVLTIDAENSGVGADVDIVANQGSDNDGTLRYNATTNEWELSNDASTFVPISTFVPAVFEAYDSTGNVSLATTQTVLNLDTTRISDSAYTLAASEVTFNQAGLYRLTGRLTSDSLDTSGAVRASAQMQFQVDTGSGFSDVNGTFCEDYMREQGNGTSSTSCNVTWLGSFSTGDKVRLTHRKNKSTTAQTVPNGSGLVIEFIR